ncbi:MAG: extracellular solute-binding protein [Phycisphaerales bacterium]|nr:MAG: extracellular solute-binding protein [Phycisphaerales bacterium]
MGRNYPAIVSCCLAALLLSACSDGESQTVVVYVSADDHIARRVIAAFEAQTGIDVKDLGDSEAVKTTGHVQRLLNEKDNPRADVFWSSEIFMTITLAEEGVLAPYESPATADWPAAFRDAGNRWYGFAARARVIAYAPDRVAPAEVPQTWQDLADPRLKGRIVMADPRFGTTGGHLGAMKAYWDQTESLGFYEDVFLPSLAENDVRIIPSGNAGVVRAIVAGEADLGLTDTDDVWAAQAQGYKVDLVYPRHGIKEGIAGQGTLLIPNTVALVAGGPNPEPAGRFVDFMLSEQVERMLAESVSHNIPLRPGLAASFSEYAVPDPLAVDYQRAASARGNALDFVMRQFASPTGGKGGDDRDDES